jgi:hypothetical protein
VGRLRSSADNIRKRTGSCPDSNETLTTLLTLRGKWWYVSPQGETNDTENRRMIRLQCVVLTAVCIGLLACAAWAMAHDPLADGSSDRPGSLLLANSSNGEYWAVCCRPVSLSRKRSGSDANCNQCTIGPINPSYVEELPSHCRWFKLREQAVEDFNRRHTCP